MTRRFTKTEVKQASYTETMRQQPAVLDRQQKSRWIRHAWSEEEGRLITKWEPGAFPRRGPDWHRQGPIDEIEQRENAGQRSLF